MQRRKFIKQGALLTAGGALATGCGSSESGGAAAVQTSPRVSWRLASTFPRSLDTIFGAAETLANRVSEITGGRFTIRVFPAGEMVPFDQVLESVQKGTVQMGHAASYYFTGLNPALAFDCTVPFGMSARQYNAWFYYGEGKDLLRSLFADFNIINFPGGNTGVQMGGWFRREISTLSDLRGLTMRIPGMGGRVMDRLGVTAQVLAGGDIYPALERGVIDATEWAGPYDDEKLGFYQVAPYYYYPGWWEPGPNLSFYVNRESWDALPAEYQAAIGAAAAEANVDMMSDYDAKNPPALQRLLDNGVELRQFSSEIMQAAHDASEELLQEEAARDPAYATMLDSYRRFMTQSNRWLGTSELSFNDFAYERV
ncbi:MAG: TRAP transporter substrate-binding protein [Rhodothermales bacterium]|nr:TRAP transporter substrate-binding protein [Rhodothermales bacterium]MBO6778949.1 TRAP transporter substrate-binding protein [Rhodothermales bacterium]